MLDKSKNDLRDEEMEKEIRDWKELSDEEKERILDSLWEKEDQEWIKREDQRLVEMSIRAGKEVRCKECKWREWIDGSSGKVMRCKNGYRFGLSENENR